MLLDLIGLINVFYETSVLETICQWEKLRITMEIILFK
jgi:hypothetical protein